MQSPLDKLFKPIPLMAIAAALIIYTLYIGGFAVKPGSFRQAIINDMLICAFVSGLYPINILLGFFAALFKRRS